MRTRHQEDLELARRLVLGDRQAFEEFFADFSQRLHRFVDGRLAGGDAAARDVVQATLFAAVRRLPTYRGEGSLAAWMFGICRFEIATERRRRRRFGPTEADLPIDLEELSARRQGVEGSSGAQEEIEQAELARRVHDALDRLPARYADALEWKYVEALSVREIARRLGTTEKAAESALTRARAAFRAEYRALSGPARPSKTPSRRSRDS